MSDLAVNTLGSVSDLPRSSVRVRNLTEGFSGSSSQSTVLFSGKNVRLLILSTLEVFIVFKVSAIFFFAF
jgi:hypothetical protein